MTINLIDEAGLTSAPIDAGTYARVLNITGYLVPEARREAVLRHLQQDDGQFLVYTGAIGRDFWRAAPARVPVYLMPEATELPARLRVADMALFHLMRNGVEKARAKAWLSAKQPKAPALEAMAFAAEWANQPLDDLQGLQAVGDTATADPKRPFQYKIVDNILTYTELARRLETWHREGGRPVGLDFETTGVDDRKASIVGLGISFSAVENFYLPWKSALPVQDLMRMYLPNLAYVAHNAKFEMKVGRQNGLPMDKAILYGDGMIAAYVLASVDEWGRPKGKGLKALSPEYTGYRQPSFQEMLDSCGAKDASEVPVKDIAPYCCGDAYLAVEVERQIRDKLDPRQHSIYEKLELPNVIVLAEMELAGLPLDLDATIARRDSVSREVHQLSGQLESAARNAGWLRSRIVTCKGHGRKKADIAACPVCDEGGKTEEPVAFNPNSRFHVAEVLQDCFDLPRMASTPTGDASNDETALLLLRQQSGQEAKDFISFLLDYREKSKTLGTYLENFIKGARLNPHTDGEAVSSLHTIHPRFNQTVVESGRLSSEDPNAQNIPLDERDLFAAPHGFLLWAADYSQLELRILARVSGCRAMIEAFQADEDIHALTAWRVFGIAKKDLTPEMRMRSKTLNFGIAYEAAAGAVQKQLITAALKLPELGLDVPDLRTCQLLVNEFWKAYPEVRVAVDHAHYRAKELGYSETIYGRRRYLPNASHPASELRARAERQSWNHIIQGTAGDIVKNATIPVFWEAPKFGADLRAQIHDELWGLVRAARAPEWLVTVGRIMVLDQPLRPVPLVVKPVVALTWKDAK